VIEEHGVVTMFVAPTAMRAIKREDAEGRLLEGRDLSRYRAHFLAGERCDPDTLEWTAKLLGVPVIDHWWQTETGSPVTAAPPGVPVRIGSAGIAMPGYDLRCLDEKGGAAPPGTVGTLALKLPLAPGALPTLYENDEGFVKSYVSDFPGYYTTFDAGWIDEDGYVFVMGRTDDIINVAGHRLSTGAIEEVLASHPAVADCAVIGVRDELKGEVPVGWIVLKQGQHVPADVAREVTELVRARIGPVAAFKQAHVVTALPKTRSGKILRRTLRQIANGDEWEIPATTEDPTVIETLARTFRRD
jgi:propionyl-CoA synthetase